MEENFHEPYLNYWKEKKYTKLSQSSNIDVEVEDTSTISNGRVIPSPKQHGKMNQPRNRLCMASMTTNQVGSKYGRRSSSDHLTPLEANAVSCSDLVSASLKALAEARHSSFVRLHHIW